MPVGRGPLPSTALAIDSIGSVKYSLSSFCTFYDGIQGE